jgi:hypothetical protein
MRDNHKRLGQNCLNAFLWLKWFKMEGPIITRYFKNEYDATYSFFMKEGTRGICEAKDLETESNFNKRKGDVLRSLTCRLFAA